MHCTWGGLAIWLNECIVIDQMSAILLQYISLDGGGGEHLGWRLGRC
jgi:hypothetical protein